ncbi:MAG: glycosyltransferase family 2 protein [Marinilabiliales bacterium]|nr:MAG: glycosyltransferase family 2 protein [Marinilabiliales bacterium]
MISICIPVYNYKVGRLVRDLELQADSCGVPCELVIIDDHSPKALRNLNEAPCSRHSYIKLEANVGRSRIRNMFTQYARYDLLLFLDCDSEIISGEFLKNYIDEISGSDAPVICGGRIYDKNLPSPGERLRWNFGRERESIPAAVRQKSPVRYFMTNNFLIRREVFDSVKFDERITQYGYEDTLFAYNLGKLGLHIRHIDNPLMHSCVETNSAFIEKTDRGIANLVSIIQYTGQDTGFINTVRILSVYFGMRKNIAGILAGYILMLLRPALRIMLCRRVSSLYLFDLYKLGLLHLLMGKTGPPKTTPGVSG